VTAGPSLRQARGSILGLGQPSGTAATTAVAQIGGQEMRRGPVWACRPADAVVQRARG
jgi:hypothetical protein